MRIDGRSGEVVIDIGLCVPQLGARVTASAVRAFVRRAEELGFASLWVQDHFMYPLQPERGYAGRPGAEIPAPYRSVLAPTEVLAAVAAWTTTVRIGTSVLVAGHHWPVPLAQRLATLDVISDGRLEVGLGLGWCVEEHHAVGAAIEDRGRRMDEFLEVLAACWGPDPVEYRGRFFDVPASIMGPKPVQAPRPRLLSGMSSPAGLARTAAHFDGWNPAGRRAADLVPVLDGLQRARPPGRARLSMHHRVFVQDPNRAAHSSDPVEHVAGLVAEDRAAGFDEVIVDASFWDQITGPEDWTAVPDRLRPLLDT